MGRWSDRYVNERMRDLDRDTAHRPSSDSQQRAPHVRLQPFPTKPFYCPPPYLSLRPPPSSTSPSSPRSSCPACSAVPSRTARRPPRIFRLAPARVEPLHSRPKPALAPAPEASSRSRFLVQVSFLLAPGTSLFASVRVPRRSWRGG
ncbi:hypothetical protein FKP32DRAFT_1115617 [Trametes sanguinea]|nr:hypothetical protein FKP32DRAFT_1115617 [Trametes sanguinea]